MLRPQIAFPLNILPYFLFGLLLLCYSNTTKEWYKWLRKEFGEQHNLLFKSLCNVIKLLFLKWLKIWHSVSLHVLLGRLTLWSLWWKVYISQIFWKQLKHGFKITTLYLFLSGISLTARCLFIWLGLGHFQLESPFTYHAIIRLLFFLFAYIYYILLIHSNFFELCRSFPSVFLRVYPRGLTLLSS